MMYDLPTSLEVCGTEYEIRSDFRAVLDVFAVLCAPELSEQEKAFGTLGIFYPNFGTMPVEHMGDALKACFAFINCGNEEKSSAPKLMDWEQDFQYLVAPVNRVAGVEIRSLPYLHWWTFMSYYYEIGDCYFAQIVRIRDLKAKGKLKDKQDREFYRKNKSVVDLKVKYSDVEDDIIRQWI